MALAIVFAFAVVGSGVAAAQPVVQFVSATSDNHAHPRAIATAPILAAAHVVGGGARVDWTGAGNLLFNTSLVHGTRDWVAQSKDHLVSDAAGVTSYVLYFDDPEQRYEVRAFYSASSTVRAAPEAAVAVPSGWVLTGGGCSVDWRSGFGPGSMLTGSYPIVRRDNTATSWVCAARDMGGASPADVVAVAIGIRPAPGAPRPARMPTMCVSSVTSAVAAHPTAVASNCARGGQITGGGARAIAPGATSDAGQLLTATFPVLRQGQVVGWEARSKDHLQSSPGTVTAFAISVSF
jgi:hypothetical protein